MASINTKNFANLIRKLASTYNNTSSVGVASFGLQKDIEDALENVISGFGNTTATSPAIASSGTTTLTFDKQRYYQKTTQTGNITLAAAGAINGATQVIDIEGDGASSLILPVAWTSGNGNSFDNTKRNLLYIDPVNGLYTYNITKSTIVIGADTTAPIIVSAATNGAGTIITLTYNEALNSSITPATTDFTTSPSKTISSVSVTGSTVLVTVSSAFVNGNTITINYTAGSNKIQDIAGNFAANLSGYSVTNNVSTFANTKSLSVGAINQIPSTAPTPTNLYFSNGTTDSDFSVAVWIKATSLPSVLQYIAVFGTASSGQGGWGLALTSANKISLNVQDKGGTASRVVESNAAITSGSWMRLVVTYKGSTGVRNMYLNGVSIAKTDTNNGAYNSLYGSGTAGLKLSIGGYIAGGFEFPATATLIDLFLLVNKELSSTEVTEDYNGGVVKDPTTLTFNANRVFDARFESNLNDSSTNAYNMTSTAAPTYSTDKP